MRYRKEGECFNNAFSTSVPPYSLAYAEGFALNSNGLWFHHAWNLNASAEVIDRTWRTPGQRYVGVIFGAAELLAWWKACRGK